MISSNQEFLDLLEPTLPPSIPELRAVAIMTANGVASVDNTSSSLGGEDDATMLQTLRDWADVVLVGSSTAIAENYGGIHTSAEISSFRSRNGQAGSARLAIVTRSFNIDTNSKLFTDATTPPIFLTPEVSQVKPEIAQRMAAITAAGASIIKYPREGGINSALHCLRKEGFNRISSEGGLSLYQELMSSGLIDSFHLTLAPLLATGDAQAFFHHPPNNDDSSNQQRSSSGLQRLQLAGVRHNDEGYVFLHYRRKHNN